MYTLGYTPTVDYCECWINPAKQRELEETNRGLIDLLAIAVQGIYRSGT
jgi:hypothetical protein